MVEVRMELKTIAKELLKVYCEDCAVGILKNLLLLTQLRKLGFA
jgi:hypothetical protein